MYHVAKYVLFLHQEAEEEMQLGYGDFALAGVPLLDFRVTREAASSYPSTTLAGAAHTDVECIKKIGRAGCFPAVKNVTFSSVGLGSEPDSEIGRVSFLHAGR